MKPLPVIVIGAGGHARVLIEALKRAGAPILGAVDAQPGNVDSKRLGVPLLGDDNKALERRPADVVLVNGVGSAGVTARRMAVYDDFKRRGYSFLTVVHPSAVVAADAVLGEGAQIMAGAVIQPGTVIGANAIVNTGATVDHDCAIGEHVHLAPGVTLSGSVTVGAGTHVGTGAKVIQGITIEANCLVKAGTVVLENVRCKTAGGVR